MSDHDDTFRTAADRPALEKMLDWQRGEIVGLLDGLTEEQARRRLVPSLTTLLGLVKHATFVERVWFHSRVAGRSREEVGLPGTVDESFTLTDDDTIATITAEFEAACARSREIAAEHPDLAERFPWRDGPVSLRFVYAHMAQEYARHAGHGDILREQILAAG
ncbi:MAG: DinB family protein [Nocardioidaceae bacterium]|nr:DinB family protein [Nocardioidaceae bacterium]MCL2612854.1 DinB family protein [Nocardioidaceae bacterium]